MGKKKAVCEACGNEFDPKTNSVLNRAISPGSGGIGAYLGSKVGIAAGSYGAIAGKAPGALLGAVMGHLIDITWVTCPDCDKTQRI